MAAPTAVSKKGVIIAIATLISIWLFVPLLRGWVQLPQDIGFDSSIEPPADSIEPLSESLEVPEKKPSRPLILYAYKETENARTNFAFFIDQGLHDAADFIFILNGETDADLLIPEGDNIRIVRRPNECFDLGAFGEVLRQDDLWKKYDRFITLNASLRGPFLPLWSDQCWSDAYLDRLNEDVKLVGMTINCGPRPHVQSMIWATDAVGMELLLYPPASAMMDDLWGSAQDTVGYGGCYKEFGLAIHAEIGGTSVIRGAGYQVSAMMSVFNKGEQYIDQCDDHPQDMLFNDHYFGTNIHPYETFFHKANRDIDPAMLDLFTNVHLHNPEGRSRALCK
ncbi:hypothetical protein F4778DRAFT_423720 [Xylariomycetidae sp. FL2044]|nr:hypothetical protein F4778DRAFT_423720 [Xylariomycetidae sp. FL2044]